MEPTKKVLVIEDDTDIVNLLTMHLSEIGLEVDSASSGRDGLAKALGDRYDLIVLDLMLPEIDGLSICRQVRAREQYVPILMLTARSAEMDKVLGLELGADDYLTKPFSVRELTARAKALMRRAAGFEQGTGTPPGKRVEIGDLVLDGARHRAFLGETELELTQKEYDLLTLLAHHPGQAFNREQLLDRVWHYQHEGYNHTVNSHINRLRAKIERDPSHPRYVRTVWGYGYRFAEPGELEREREDGA